LRKNEPSLFNYLSVPLFSARTGFGSYGGFRLSEGFEPEVAQGRQAICFHVAHRAGAGRPLRSEAVSLVLEEGKGPELVTRGGRYAQLYRSANLGG